MYSHPESRFSQRTLFNQDVAVAGGLTLGHRQDPDQRIRIHNFGSSQRDETGRIRFFYRKSGKMSLSMDTTC